MNKAMTELLETMVRKEITIRNLEQYKTAWEKLEEHFKIIIKEESNIELTKIVAKNVLQKMHELLEG